MCTKILVNAGIKEIVYKDDYVDELSRAVLDESGIRVRQYTGPNEDEQ
jgi:dCMP deaminase